MRKAVPEEERELRFMQLCAYVNVNSDCYDKAEEMKAAFAPHLDDLLLDDDDDDADGGGGSGDDRDGGGRGGGRRRTPLEDAVAHRSDVLLDTSAGFLATAREALRRIAGTSGVILGDPCFVRPPDKERKTDEGLLLKLFVAPDWRSGAVCEVICATLRDYVGDLREFLKPAWFPRAVEELMVSVLGLYGVYYISQCKEMNDATHARMGADLADLRAVFEEALAGRRDSETRLKRAFQNLAGARTPLASRYRAGSQQR